MHGIGYINGEHKRQYIAKYLWKTKAFEIGKYPQRKKSYYQ
jgi:hypothetical protein